MINSETSIKNPLRLILNSTIAIFIILLLAYIGIHVAIMLSTFDSNSAQSLELKSLLENIKSLSNSVFDFIQPFLQLVIILTILEWLLVKVGLINQTKSIKLDWNVQALIGLIVIIAFCLAALSGVQGAGMLKDLALVVVGFYFGSQKKTNEMIQGDSKVTITEEHTNER